MLVATGSGRSADLSNVGHLYAKFGSADDSFSVTDATVTLEGGAGVDSFTGSFTTNTTGISFALDQRAGAVSTFIGQYSSLKDFERIIVTTGSGNDSITGGDLSDQIDAGLGQNVIDGGGGDDILRSSGVDKVQGGSGVDTWTGNYSSATAAIAFIQQTGMVYALSNGGSVDGVERIYLTTGSGNDDYRIGRGAQLYDLNGWAGTDSLTIDWSASTTAIEGSVSASPYVTRGALYDTVTGHQIAFAAIEQLNATLGSGNDRFSVSDVAATLDGGAGVDGFVGAFAASQAAISFTLNTAPGSTSTFVGQGTTLRNFERVDVTTGAGNDTLTGGDGADRLAGGAGTNVLNGRDGDDVLSSAGGIDRIDGGAGFDRWIADYSRTTAGLSFLHETGSRHALSNGGSIVDVEDVTFSAGTGRDVFRIAAGTTNYTINAGTGYDTLTLDWSAAVANVSIAIGRSTAGISGTLSYRADGEQKASFQSFEKLTILTGTGDDFVTSIDAAAAIDAGAGVDRYSGYFGRSSSSISFELNVAAGSISTIVGQGTTLSNVEIVQIEGGSAEDRLTGGLFGDQLVGGRGDDIIDGGPGTVGGIDRLYGGDGSDTLSYATATAGVTVSLANQGEEVQTGGAGIDYIIGFENLVGSTFADRLTGDAAINVIDGGDGDDVLTGGSGDTLIGGGGADTFIVHGGETIWGGSGSNRAIVAGVFTDFVLSADGAALLLQTSDVTTRLNEITSIAFIDGDYDVATSTFSARNPGVTVSGTAGADVIGPKKGVAGQPLPGTGSDVIFGYAGNDRLDGGAGADTMHGGLGNDIYYVDNKGDRTIEAEAEGTDLVYASVDYTLALNVEQLTLTGVAEKGVGNEHANIIKGNASANVLSGLAGSDKLYGLGGNDVLLGGSGADTLDGGVGADRMEGGEGNDTYVVDDRQDAVIELVEAGLDIVNSTVTYTLGDNVENLTLSGLASIDGSGNLLGNVIRGNAAANVLSGLGGSDTIYGGSDGDTLQGGEGPDYLLGEADDDSLHGGEGADRLVGGAGSDTLEGGEGNDLFVFSKVEEIAGDLIVDFSSGDRFDLRSIDANTNTSRNDAFTFIGSAAFTHKAGELRFELAGDDTLVLGDINGDGSADFILTVVGRLSLVSSDFVL